MIKFFRQIRQNMVLENKTGKYLKYAIGEIILVVIGILIALQINNWNESRKEHLTERNLLISLEEDLSRNKVLMERNISGLNFILKRIDLLLTARAENRAYNDTLDGYFHLARVFPESQLSFVAFNEIKTKGTDIIESTILRKRIVDLFEIRLSNMIETTNRLESALRPIQLEHQLKNFFSRENSELVPNNKEKIMLDSEYFNIVSQRRLYYKMFLALKENCVRELDTVQYLIEQELIH